MALLFILFPGDGGIEFGGSKGGVQEWVWCTGKSENEARARPIEEKAKRDDERREGLNVPFRNFYNNIPSLHRDRVTVWTLISSLSEQNAGSRNISSDCLLQLRRSICLSS